MAEYEKKVRDILAKNRCSFVRRGKGDHDIWYSPIPVEMQQWILR